jgi:hypothetical protein
MSPSSKCYQAHQHQLPTYQGSHLAYLYAVEAPHLDRDKFERANIYNNPYCNHKFAALISLAASLLPSSSAPRKHLHHTYNTQRQGVAKPAPSQRLFGILEWRQPSHFMINNRQET